MRGRITLFLVAIAMVVSLPREILGATRCYDNLGCYESGDLHALPQEPSFVRTQFRISCRNSTDDVSIDAVTGDATVKQQIEASCFDVSRKTKFVIHGFNDAAYAEWMKQIRDKFLEQYDYNIILIDWHHGARFPYEQAVANSYMVARQVYNFLHHLDTVHGLDPMRMHLIGHSLGAQISGNAGAKMAPLNIARITALDPASPYFEGVNNSRRLDPNDADFVDVIHSDGEKFTGLKGFGTLRSQGHVDFYPNGGEKQPGCVPPSSDDITSELDVSQGLACSHSRAHELFLHSIDATACQLTSYTCNSWVEFEDGNCTDCSTQDCLVLGSEAKGASSVGGKYYLSTWHREPFCGSTFKIKISLSAEQSHAYGRIFLRLWNGQGSAELVDFSRSNRHYHAGETETHMITSTAGLDENTKITVFFDKGSGLSSLGTSDFLFVSSVTVTSFDSLHSWSLCSGGVGGIHYGIYNTRIFDTACPPIH